MRRTILVIAALALAIGAAGCGSDTAAAEDPPWGLDSIGLPDDVDAIERVFAAMPDRVAGLARLDASPNEADYEGDALVTVMRLGEPTENVPATNAVEFLRGLSEAGKVGEIQMEQERLAATDRSQSHEADRRPCGRSTGGCRPRRAAQASRSRSTPTVSPDLVTPSCHARPNTSGRARLGRDVELTRETDGDR